MKKFLKVLIALQIIFLILIVVLMFISPKKMVLSESITMDAPAHMIYNQVIDFKKWNSWSPWSKLDSTAIFTYSKRSSGVGARYSWKGNADIGEGSQKILGTDPDKSINTSLEFNGMSGTSLSNWTFESVGDKTEVTWDFEGAESGFVFRPFNLIFKPGLKKQYREGLNAIKAIVEKRAKEKIYKGFKINTIQLPEKHYLAIRQEINLKNIQQFYSRNLPPLFNKISVAGIQTDGMPGGLFYQWDESNGKTDMAASVPIKKAVEVPGAILQTIPAGPALQIDYYGDYDGSIRAHYAMEEYMEDFGLLNNVPIVEEYVTDPTVEKNPKKWLTKITYYLAAN
jgi:effector-binding domain-containing protein